MKGNYYVQAIFTVLLVIAATGVIIEIVQSKIDYNMENIKREIIDEYYKCEFHYKDLDYRGICNNEIMERAEAYIEFDMTVRMLDICMKTPYAYRYNLCKEYEVK